VGRGKRRIAGGGGSGQDIEEEGEEVEEEEEEEGVGAQEKEEKDWKLTGGEEQVPEQVTSVPGISTGTTINFPIKLYCLFKYPL